MAGGRARRLNSVDKGLIMIKHKPLIAYTIERMKPQVSDIIISTNRNFDAYKKFGYPVVSDESPDYLGPLSGLLSAMNHIINNQPREFNEKDQSIFLIACDMPKLPSDFIHRVNLYHDKHKYTPDTIYTAHDGTRRQSLCMYIPITLKTNLETYIQNGNSRVESWIIGNNSVDIDYSDTPDAFWNINTQEDIGKFETFV